MVKITILSDNSVAKKHLKAEWGFSALVEAGKHKILFDTGADDFLVIENMKELDITAMGIGEIFISHSHWDHVGGLASLLQLKEVNTYVPYNFTGAVPESSIVKIKKGIELHKNIYTTGTLDDIEQSLVIKTNKGTVVIAGCSHPGVDKILKAAGKHGKPYALIGGLHDFENFDILKDIKYVCPTHCTKYSEKIKKLYPEKYLEGGTGRVIKIA